jgi:hypothetical protein
MATVGDLVIIHADPFDLPRPDPSTIELFTAKIDFNYQLPPGTRSHGILAAEMLTLKKYDDSIDVAFTVSQGGATWTSEYRRSEFLSRVWVVGTAPGTNILEFDMTKYGIIKTEHGEYNGGGGGICQFANVVLWYSRTA